MVSTAKLLLQTLPATARADRAAMIRGHTAKLAGQGAPLPDNLSQMLDGELKKLGNLRK